MCDTFTTGEYPLHFGDDLDYDPDYDHDRVTGVCVVSRYRDPQLQVSEN